MSPKGIKGSGPKVCKVDECDRDTSKGGFGFCGKHYQRWKKHGDPLLGPANEHPCSVDGCDQPANSRGWCKPHYDRWHIHGDPLWSEPRGPVGSPEERFWNNVDRRDPDECWPWTGGLTRRNYARDLSVDGRPVKPHRFCYELHHGPIPDGLTIDHTCHNESDCRLGNRCPHRHCMNPAHLDAVTIKENVGRARRR